MDFIVLGVVVVVTVVAMAAHSCHKDEKVFKLRVECAKTKPAEECNKLNLDNVK